MKNIVKAKVKNLPDNKKEIIITIKIPKIDWVSRKGE